jgi:hypothetical protein
MNSSTQKVKRSVKGVILITLASIYLLFSVGIMKATHFCMGRKASVSYFTSESDKCICSLYAGEKDDCCDDEHEVIRLDDEQKVIQTFSISNPVFIQLEDFTSSQLIASIIPVKPQQIKVTEVFSPPPVALFKVHCSFVYYDEELIG